VCQIGKPRRERRLAVFQSPRADQVRSHDVALCRISDINIARRCRLLAPTGSMEVNQQVAGSGALESIRTVSAILVRLICINQN
jgi:hypothetical protein